MKLSQLELLDIYHRELAKTHGCGGAALQAVAYAAVQAEREGAVVAHVFDGSTALLTCAGADLHPGDPLFASPQSSATVPEGYALVPVEPTSAMLDRAVALMLNVKVSSAYTWTQYARDLWATMLAASQPVADKAQGVAS